jgi:hypothetical protein
LFRDSLGRGKAFILFRAAQPCAWWSEARAGQMPKWPKTRRAKFRLLRRYEGRAWLPSSKAEHAILKVGGTAATLQNSALEAPDCNLPHSRHKRLDCMISAKHADGWLSRRTWRLPASIVRSHLMRCLLALIASHCARARLLQTQPGKHEAGLIRAISPWLRPTRDVGGWTSRCPMALQF